MVIEWLKFRVTSHSREKFIQQDAQIWTSFLEKYPAFLGKEVWINPKQPDEIICVIRWQNKESWNAIPQNLLEATEQQFAAAMGETAYNIIEGSEYQVRKFPTYT
ncbi:MAG: TIGR03792 family protein [Gomphosphaeria aponina SAG 52.96 = DSM 107014]|uniref:TIGR03792 family protein n=1 Tax=Gomphosphaeria aponina SAG 52.96 = DSM 107014 TaxID=1521640 RepID=A0A941JTU0_9CHRO|nr:TIGR03792 family protein [Gomphosphaeria aponina SAG 52.96 = DSM 107014]